MLTSRRALLVSLVAALSFAAIPTASAKQQATFPQIGVFIPGKSLGGVHLGMTQTQVRSLWGSNFKICKLSLCAGTTTWYYIYPKGEPVGAAVVFKGGKVVTVFTLGSPAGWHTAEGLIVGEEVDKVNTLYGKTGWTACIGYGAMILQKGAINTAVYTTGAVVYGFAMTANKEPICQ